MYTALTSIIAPKYIYENITVTRDANYKSIMSAYTIIEEYIKSNKLILYGGMSIDFALRAAGHKGIYADDSIPDYDFYSPNAYDDSIKIADILYTKKLPQISAINALHPTTRRVRVNYTYVADISYLPESVFNSMPYLEYSGIRVIHPMYQRLDQHRAMAIPYEGAPGETVYFRGAKDIERFKLLDRAYPITIEPELISKIQKSKMEIVKIPLRLISGEVLSGIPAYSLIYSIMKSAYPDECSQLCPIMFSSTKTAYEISIPLELNSVKMCILSSNFIKLQKKLNQASDTVKYFKRYMDDIKPRSIEILGQIHWDLYDFSKFPITCEKISNIQKASAQMGLKQKFDYGDIFIAAVPNLLLYFLSLYYIESNPGYLYLYWSTCKLVEIAEEHIKGPDDPLCTLLFLTAKIKGTHNVDFPYILSTKRNYETIHSLEDTISTTIPVKGYFPSTSDAIPAPFDISASWIFDMDGSELEPGKKFEKCDYDMRT